MEQYGESSITSISGTQRMRCCVCEICGEDGGWENGKVDIDEF